MDKIEELKKEKLSALKDKNTNKSNLLSVIIQPVLCGRRNRLPKPRSR